MPGPLGFAQTGLSSGTQRIQVGARTGRIAVLDFNLVDQLLESAAVSYRPGPADLNLLLGPARAGGAFELLFGSGKIADIEIDLTQKITRFSVVGVFL